MIGIQGSERRRNRERCKSPRESLSLSIIGGIMRATEFMHFMNRTDIGLGAKKETILIILLECMLKEEDMNIKKC